MSSNQTHKRIDELLRLMIDHNHRLRSQDEGISQLDIDVFRKQCIELYEELNKLTVGIHVSLTNEVSPKRKSLHNGEEKSTEKSLESTREMGVIEQKKVKNNINQDNDEMLSLFEKFNNEPITSVTKGISIAKRFEFQKVFFDGDSAAYTTFISQLDEADDREAAFKIYKTYKSQGNWENEELKDELKSLIYRKHG